MSHNNSTATLHLVLGISNNSVNQQQPEARLPENLAAEQPMGQQNDLIRQTLSLVSFVARGVLTARVATEAVSTACEIIMPAVLLTLALTFQYYLALEKCRVSPTNCKDEQDHQKDPSDPDANAFAILVR